MTRRMKSSITHIQVSQKYYSGFHKTYYKSFGRDNIPSELLSLGCKEAKEEEGKRTVL